MDWTYTFTSEFLTVPNSGPYFAQDDTGTYLYFVASGQTLILDKETGALLAKLPVAVGNVNFVDQNRILTVKSDGIYAIHTGTGAMTKVYSGTIGAGGTRVSGVLQCVIQAGKTLYRGKMDLTTGKMRLQPLEGSTAEGGSYSAEAFGTDGTLLVKEVNGTRITFTKYGTSGQILATHSYAADRLAGMAVRDGSGNVDYVVYTVNSKSSDKYKTTMICAELATGRTASASLTDVNGYPAEVRIIAAEQVDETVYMAVGGYLTWIANYSWGNGPTHGYPQRTRVAQFNMAGPSGSIVAAGVMGMDNMKEYGKSSEVYGVIQSGQNGQYQSPPSGNITTLYRRNQTVEEAAERLKAKYLGDGSDRDLQKAFVLTEADLRDEGLAQLVDRQLDYDSMDRTSYVKLTPEEENASLSRTVALKPDTTYYYEYDLYTPEEGAEPKDVFAVEPSLSRVTEEHLTGLQYRVVKSEKIADRIQAVTGAVKSKVSTSTKTTSFTVEEGQRAVLSFDYLVQKYSVSAYLADYVLIDGVRWKMPFHKSATTTTYSGHYTHPFLLEAGEHTIQVTARSYGTHNSTLTIDDVTLEYVEQGAPVLKEAQSQIRSLGDGWSRVSGSFTTPKETLAYEGLEGTVKAETAGTGGFTSTAKPNDITTNLTIAKPTSETAIYTSVQTTSKPLRKDSKYYSVQWTVGGVSYYAYVGGYWGTNDDERITTFDLPHSHDFVLADGWSNAAVQLITKGSYSNGYSSGSMGQILMASVVQPNDATTQRRYFLDLENEAILASNLRYENEATIRFAPNGEDSGAGVANLRIYTVQNGVREYAVEEDITDPVELERWTKNGLTAEPMEDGAPVEETDSLVYAKGQLVTMDIQYRDYENDPSKASYYRYTHEPFNDGLHPLAEQVLTEPIDRFYVDGKYILEHYQIDSTGDPDYDKASNIATAVFYIGGAGDAPWIESIATNPAKPEEGSPFTIRVAVDDTEKDPLTLKVEVYKEGTRIYTETFSNLTANSSGDYPPATTSPIAGAEAGRYEVVCTVSDETGTGIANRQFTIQPAGRIEGQVAHTAAWDSNRRSYNRNLFGSNASLYNNETMSLAQYLSYSEPRPRGKNVFWAGEELI
ncbi:MAG: hypothetical protein IJB07_02270, partial [Firmicutes bacterium]|nr:hypothetical protein [Bacillota bacterium]